MMDIGLWQVPLLVGASIVVLAHLVWWIARAVAERSGPKAAQPGPRVRPAAALRTLALAALSIVLFGLLVLASQAIGTSTAADLAALASLLLEAAALRWTYLSYRAARRSGGAADVPVVGQPEQVATVGGDPDWPGERRSAAD